VLGYLGVMVSDPVVTVVAAAVVGAIFGFLRFNTYPATIFMGDAGSQLLGFLAIVLALQLTQNNAALSPTLPLLFLGFPILDTLTVMLARIYHGRSPFSADKNHFHHKLMRLGLLHSEAVLGIYLLQMALVLTAYMMRYCSDWMIVGGYLVFAAVVSLFFFLSAHFRWHLKRRQEGEYNLLQKRLAELDKLTFMLKGLFRLLQMNFVLVLLIVIVPTAVVPSWLAGTAVVMGGLLLLSLIKRKPVKLHSFLLRLAIYLTLPILIYNRAVNGGSAMVEVWWQDYTLFTEAAYFTMILLALLLLKFTRRSGYKSTPLDFLILGVALLVPVIATQAGVGANLGMVAVQMVALFFTFEVIIEESRRRNWWLDLSVIGCMLIVGLKWMQSIL
jgi:UDP-GlcNAc:undecaprenyl-phosphate GlcNAc-1-phosphate transferase